jgi:CRISPR-associated protein Csy2
MSTKDLLIIPHLKVHNANALSSPFTIGFPAMTAWLGFTHALQRKLNQIGFGELEFKSVAVVSHHFDLQTYKGAGDFVSSIVGTGNPLDKDGSRSAFIEEARCHLEVTVVIEWEGNDEEVDDNPEFIEKITHLLNSMKFAGGDILSFSQPELEFIDDNEQKSMQVLTRKLMPGYLLIERRELMVESMEEGKDALDALLDFLTVNHQCEQYDEDAVNWTSLRKASGWIMPIAIGFQGISELGQAKNQRDPDTLHCFAESVVTLGEFVMPHKIKKLDDMLWCYHADTENKLYLCQQNNHI